MISKNYMHAMHCSLIIAVKGAKYDPNGRPPKGIPSSTTTGWVGPPAGLKYPDRPPSGKHADRAFSNHDFVIPRLAQNLISIVSWVSKLSVT